jgi:hypothetical protein
MPGPQRADADIVWLLTIELTGLTFRLSTQPITIFDATTAAPIPYDGGLSQVDYAEQIDILRAEPASQQVAVEGYLDIPTATLRARGYDLREARATLGYVLAPYLPSGAQHSLTTADVITVAAGIMAQPVTDDPERPDGWFAASFEAVPWGSGAKLLDSRALITKTDFPDAHEDAINAVMPLVIGQPGATGTTQTYATPAYVIDQFGAFATKLLIAGYDARIFRYGVPMVGTVALNVEIHDGSAGSYSYDVEQGITASGLFYFFVDLGVDLTDPIDRIDARYSVYWDEASGVSAVTRGRSRAGAGEALVYLLARAGMAVDVVASAPALDRLRAISFNGYLNDPDVSAWDYVSTQVLPYLPLTVRQGPDGLIFGYLDHDVGPAGCVARIDAAAEGWVRLSAITQDEARPPLSLTITGGINAVSGLSSSVAQFDPQAVAGAADTRVPINIGARVAAGLNRLNVTEPIRQKINLPWCDDQRSLYAIGLMWMAFRASPPSTATYSAPPPWAHLAPGDAVAVTDPTRGWADRVCWVKSRKWDAGRWLFDLWTIDRPAWA